jgi:zinc transporter, ZIP family
MLGASHNLITEGSKLDLGRMLLGILAGLIAIVAANWLIRQRRTGDIAEPHGASHVRRCSFLES